jgi:hypothetical protein
MSITNTGTVDCTINLGSIEQELPLSGSGDHLGFEELPDGKPSTPRSRSAS